MLNFVAYCVHGVLGHLRFWTVPFASRPYLQRLAVYMGTISISLGIACLIVICRDRPPETEPSDYLTKPFVKDGQASWLKPFVVPPPAKLPALSSKARICATAFRGLVIGHIEASLADSAEPPVSLAHAIELQLQCSLESITGSMYLGELLFQQAREASLMTTQEVEPVHVSESPELLFSELLASSPHTGHRRVHPETVAQEVFGWQDFRMTPGTRDQAFLCVSSLAGKRVRMMVDSHGTIVALQPIDCHLSESEFHWLRQCHLPRLLFLDEGNEKSLEIHPETMSQILPNDLGFAIHIRALKDSRQQVIRTPSLWKMAWRAEPGFFRNLYPPSVFVDSEVRNSVAVNATCIVY